MATLTAEVPQRRDIVSFFIPFDTVDSWKAHQKERLAKPIPAENLLTRPAIFWGTEEVEIYSSGSNLRLDFMKGGKRYVYEYDKSGRLLMAVEGSDIHRYEYLPEGYLVYEKKTFKSMDGFEIRYFYRQWQSYSSTGGPI